MPNGVPYEVYVIASPCKDGNLPLESKAIDDRIYFSKEDADKAIDKLPEDIKKYFAIFKAELEITARVAVNQEIKTTVSAEIMAGILVRAPGVWKELTSAQKEAVKELWRTERGNEIAGELAKWFESYQTPQ